jgi:hypothetical protein
MRRLIAAAVLAAFGLGAADSVLAGGIPFPIPPKFTDIPFPVPPRRSSDIPFPVPPR